MEHRRWQTERTGRRSGMLRLGRREALARLPPDAVVAITHSRGLQLWQALLNNLFSRCFIMPGLTHNPDLLLAELYGDLDALDTSLTLTVWRGRGMVAFRDRRAHGWAKRVLTGWLFGGPARTWFLTYQPRDGRLPTVEEAIHLAETYGKLLHNGRVVRSAARPS